MNTLDELSELSEDGLEYSDEDVDFLPDCVSSIEDSDSDSEISVGSQNTIQNINDDDDNKLDRNISEESKRYAIQKNSRKPLTLSENEINQQLGICIDASLVHLPNFRTYWSEELGLDRIKETMPNLKLLDSISILMINIYQEIILTMIGYITLDPFMMS
ncbi:hypothetical protein TNCV_3723871 [Trichonephila clavipes]|nr:hypothetical protein TNCV_3723871 [Trichonephila clavipes]